MSPAARVWSYRARAAAWAAAGVWSFVTGRQESVALVWLASIYANVATDLGAAQAADDRRVLDELARLHDRVAALDCACTPNTQPSDPGEAERP